MEWSVFLTALDEAVREYEERTFADWMDGRRGDSINDDTYDDWEEDTYDQ